MLFCQGNTRIYSFRYIDITYVLNVFDSIEPIYGHQCNFLEPEEQCVIYDVVSPGPSGEVDESISLECHWVDIL